MEQQQEEETGEGVGSIGGRQAAREFDTILPHGKHQMQEISMAGLQTLHNAVDILDVVAQSSGGLSIRDIAGKVGLVEATTYRYVATLKSRGLLSESEKAGHYILGTGIITLYRALRSNLSLSEAALPIMRRLAAEIGETVLLSTISGTKGICIEKVESSQILRVTYIPGATFYLHAGATGKVLLASLPAERQQFIIGKAGLPRLTDNTTTDPAVLKDELAKIRGAGFCVTDGEQLVGVRAISIPILESAGSGMPAALSIEGPVRRLEGRSTERAVELLLHVAKQLQ